MNLPASTPSPRATPPPVAALAPGRLERAAPALAFLLVGLLAFDWWRHEVTEARVEAARFTWGAARTLVLRSRGSAEGAASPAEARAGVSAAASLLRGLASEQASSREVGPAVEAILASLAEVARLAAPADPADRSRLDVAFDRALAQFAALQERLEDVHDGQRVLTHGIMAGGLVGLLGLAVAITFSARRARRLHALQAERLQGDVAERTLALEQAKRERELEAEDQALRKQQVFRFQQTLLHLSTTREGDFGAFARRAVPLLAADLRAERIWIHEGEAGAGALRPVVGFSLAGGQIGDGPALTRAERPLLFGVLTQGTAPVTAAGAHPLARELADLMPAPPEASSLLLLPFHSEGRLQGVLSLGHGGSRDWAPEELDYVQRAAGILALAWETAARVRAQERLATSEFRLKTVTDSVLEAIISADSGNVIRSWNQGAERIFGHTAEQAIGQPIGIIMPARMREAHRAGMARYVATGVSRVIGQTLQLPGIRRDGTEFPVEMSISTWKANQETGFTAILRDITQRRASEEEQQRANEQLERMVAERTAMIAESERRLAESELHLRTLLGNLRGVAYRTRDEGWRMAFVSQGWEDLLGFDPVPWMADDGDLATFIHPEDLPRVTAALATALAAQDGGYSLEYRVLGHRGERWVSDRGVLQAGAAGGRITREGFMSDVTDMVSQRNARERALQLANAALEASPDGVMFTGPSGQLEIANPKLVQLVSWEEAAAVVTVEQVFGALRRLVREREDIDRMLTRTQEKPESPDSAIFPCQDGRHLEITTRPDLRPDGIRGRVWIVRDITESVQRQRQEHRAQRLESIGTLAGGLAHDLNNALTPILVATDLLEAGVAGNQNLLGTIRASATRATGMVRHLLNFARGAEGKREVVAIDRLLHEIELIVRGTFPKSIRCDVVLGPGLHGVLGDSTQLHQLLLNLAVNARDAMPEGGRLTLRAGNATIDETYAATVPEAKPGQYVLFEVSDTGTGIPPAIMDRIFDPFFTTKPPEKGSGLGLSTVLGIVKGHGGFLRAYSPRDQGASFHIYLPAIAAVVVEEAAVSVVTEDGLEGAGRTILLVDDEPAVREITARVLAAGGFAVVTAADGAAAVAELAERRDRIAAIVTDVHMPNMDGLAFARVARRMSPRTPILVVSGRMEKREQAEFVEIGVTSFLGKPFTREQFNSALAQLLAAT